MSFTLLDAYQTLRSVVSNPDDNSTFNLPKRNQVEYKDLCQSALTTRYDEFKITYPDINFPDYRLFINNVNQGQHPAKIFLNKLVRGVLLSSNPQAAYILLLDYWDSCEENKEDIEKFNESHSNFQNAPKVEFSIETIEDIFKRINSTLVGVSKPYGLMPLILEAWYGCPEYITAFVLWLRRRGESDADIVKSELFHCLFILNIGNPDNKEGLVFKLIACMRLFGELASIIDILSKIPAKFELDEVENETMQYHSSFPHLTLTGEKLAGYSDSNLVSSQTLEGLGYLILQDNHNNNDYFVLFGLTYLKGLILSRDIRYTQFVSDILINLDSNQTSELFRYISEEDFEGLDESYLTNFVNILNEDQLFKLIEDGQRHISNLIPQDIWDKFFSKKSPQEKTKFLEEAKSRPNMAILLIKLYFQTDISLDMKNAIYEIVLNYVLNGYVDFSSEEWISTFGINSHKEIIQNAANSLNIYLAEIESNVSSDGLTERDVKNLIDEWCYRLPYYRFLQTIGPDIISSFPETYFALYARIISLEINKKQERFDLKSVLNLLEIDVNRQKRLLVKLFFESNEDVKDILIKQIHSNFVDFEAVYHDIIIQTAKNLNEHLYKRITGQDVNANWVNSAFMSATIKNKADYVSCLLTFTGENKPSQFYVCEALLFAIDEGHDEVVKTIISMTGDNKASKSYVVKALSCAVDKGHDEVVKMIIAMTGDNKPLRYYFEEALSCAFKKGYDDVAKTILSMTGDNKPSQSYVEQVLLFAVDNSQDNVVKTILSMTGDNKPSQSYVEKALLLAKGKIKTIISMSMSINGLQEYTNNPAVSELYTILNNIFINIKDNKFQDAFNSLKSQRTAIDARMCELSSILDVKTWQNIAATIGSVVLFLTVVGSPFAYMLWKNNFEQRRDYFMFFSEGAKQKAQIVQNHIIHLEKLCPSQ